MKLLEKFVFSKNVWAVSISAVVIWLAFSGMGSMLQLQNQRKVFIYYLGLVSASFFTAAVTVKAIHKILSLKFSFENISVDPIWVFVLIVGSYLFVCLFEQTLSLNFEFFIGVFVLGVVPAGLFRVIINWIIPYLFESKNSKISIVNQ